jgi:uncharacterized protein YbbK (DUF523 family)
MSDTHDSARIRVGISACLLGQQVRYNGGHKQSTLCTQQLAQYFDFVPTCPELGAGLGVPRPAIRLVGDPAAPRAVAVEHPGRDATAQLLQYAAERLPQLQELCGYIFIRNSPSCGLFGVRVYQDNGAPQPEGGRGLFAAALTRAMPLLPVEEEGRLQDLLLRENFITRVFAWHDWRLLEAEGLSAEALTDFHARYQCTLQARKPQACSELERLLAAAGRQDPLLIGRTYFAGLMQALQPGPDQPCPGNPL